MRFLVLGASGMAGHVICIYLKEKGHDVTGYCRRSVSFVEFIKGDAKNIQHLQNVITTGNYDIIVNAAGCAASTEVLYSITTTAGDNGDFMPPYNGYNPAQITQDYFATVNNSAEVTIVSTGAALLAEDANKIRDDTTLQKYKLGIDNGLIYIQEVDE